MTYSFLLAEALGKRIGEFARTDDGNNGKRIVLVTGACHSYSIPSTILRAVKEENSDVPVVGISPFGDVLEARQHDPGFSDVMKLHDLLVFTDFGEYVSRDPNNVLLSEGAIFARGGPGTANEATIMMDKKGVLGVYLGMGNTVRATVRVFLISGLGGVALRGIFGSRGFLLIRGI